MIARHALEMIGSHAEREIQALSAAQKF